MQVCIRKRDNLNIGCTFRCKQNTQSTYNFRLEIVFVIDLSLVGQETSFAFYEKLTSKSENHCSQLDADLLSNNIIIDGKNISANFTNVAEGYDMT